MFDFSFLPRNLSNTAYHVWIAFADNLDIKLNFQTIQQIPGIPVDNLGTCANIIASDILWISLSFKESNLSLIH